MLLVVLYNKPKVAHTCYDACTHALQALPSLFAVIVNILVAVHARVTFLVVVLFTHWVAGCQRLYTWLRHEGFQTTEPLESIWAVLGDLTHDFIGPRLARKVDLLLWSLGPSDYFKIWRHKLEKSNVRFKGSYFWGTTFAEAKRRLLSPITNWVVRFDFKICTHTTWK